MPSNPIKVSPTGWPSDLGRPRPGETRPSFPFNGGNRDKLKSAAACAGPMKRVMKGGLVFIKIGKVPCTMENHRRDETAAQLPEVARSGTHCWTTFTTVYNFYVRGMVLNSPWRNFDNEVREMRRSYLGGREVLWRFPLTVVDAHFASKRALMIYTKNTFKVNFLHLVMLFLGECRYLYEVSTPYK